MLAVPAEFPHIGSTGYIKHTAQPVRIIQRNADGTCTVELLPPRFLAPDKWLDWAAKGATRTRREDAEDLFETPEAAILPKTKLPRQSRRATSVRRGPRGARRG